MTDRNLYRCGLWGLISVGVSIVGGLICGIMSGNGMVSLATTWGMAACLLLPWCFFACSSAKWGKAMWGYVLTAIVVRVLSHFIRGDLETNLAIALGWAVVGQLAFAVTVLVVMLKNVGKVRKALVFFTVTSWIDCFFYALSLIVGVMASPLSPVFTLVTACQGCVGCVLRVVSVAGFLFMMTEAAGGSSDKRSVIGVPRRWRIFWGLAPWLMLIPPHFNRATIMYLCAPAGLFGLFCSPQNLNGKLPLLIAAGLLIYIVLTVAIFCFKSRRITLALVSTFVVFLLLNAGGCVRMLGNFF